MSLFRESTTRYLVGIWRARADVHVVRRDLRAARRDAGRAAPKLAADASAMSSDLAPAALPPGTVTLLYRPAGSTGRDFAWVARGWLAGVCLLALRIAFGLLLLEHLRRRNLSALPVEIVERCRALQQRLGISRVVRYCECRLVTVPSVIGFFRPIVLLPHARAHRPQRRAARSRDRARARAHQALRRRRQFLPGDRRDAVLLPSRGVVAQQAHPRRSRRLL